jgi:hypothetical protein
MRHARVFSLQSRKPFVVSTFVAVVAAAASTAWASTNPDLPAAEHAGVVTYLSGGSALAQTQAVQSDATEYPLELQFVWGRGAKETPVTASEWSIRDATDHVLVVGRSGGPVILASLPNGRYIVQATYDGDTLRRVVHVRKGTQDDVLLEWPQ